MNKIFYYELRRIVSSKSFLGLGVVAFWYGWQILSTVTILGTAHTAPFSPWSFGSYLSRLLPLLCVALLFLIWNQCNAKARQVEELTNVAAQSPGNYWLVKCGAAVTAWLLLVLSLAVLGIGFLLALFGRDVLVSAYVIPALAAVLPPMILLFGTGLLAGSLHPSLLFGMMVLAFGLGFLSPPDSLDLYSSTLFSRYPLTLDHLDPAFSMSLTFLAGKCAMIFIGAAAFFIRFDGTKPAERKRKYDKDSQ